MGERGMGGGISSIVILVTAPLAPPLAPPLAKDEEKDEERSLQSAMLRSCREEERRKRSRINGRRALTLVNAVRNVVRIITTTTFTITIFLFDLVRLFSRPLNLDSSTRIRLSFRVSLERFSKTDPTTDIPGARVRTGRWPADARHAEQRRKGSHGEKERRRLRESRRRFSFDDRSTLEDTRWRTSPSLLYYIPIIL